MGYNEEYVNDDDDSGDDVEALLVGGGKDGDLLLGKPPLGINPEARVPPSRQVSCVSGHMISNSIPQSENS